MDSLASSALAGLALDKLGLPQFRERAPWLGGDLQTMRNFLRRPAIDLTPFRYERLELPLNDGSGDRLAAALQWPVVRRDGRPVVLLIHGLTGCQDSVHIRMTAAHLLRAGFPVLRLNLRGAGPSRTLCHQHYHAA